LLATLVAIAAPQPARAATVIVNTTADAASGGCETTGTGPDCTLREAIIFANDHPGTVITILAGTYKLTKGGPNENEALTGDLDIQENVTINGAGPQATIIIEDSPGTKDRIFDVFAATGATRNVSINGVQLTQGSARDGFGGGALWIGTHMNVTLTNTLVSQNSTIDGRGGQIVLEGPGSHLSVVGSRIDSGLAISQSEAVARGGGIYVHDGTLDVLDSVISTNSAFAQGIRTNVGGSDAQGGGLFIDTGTASVTRSLIERNAAQANDGEDGGAGLEVDGGDATGGGIVALGGSTLNIVNSTLTGNRALGGAGVGASGDGGAATAGAANVLGTLSVIHATIADNHAVGGTAPTGGSRGSAQVGGLAVGAGTSSMANSIVARNTVDPAGLPGRDLQNPTTAFGHNNLIGVADSGTQVGPSDLAGTAASPLDPRIEFPLADHGDPTPTLGLLAGSPAIDAAAADACAAAGNVDQRGFARPNPPGGRCDIGAFEFTFTPTTVTLVSSVNPAQIGQAVTFTATVSGAGGTPTGTVSFIDGRTGIGGGTVVGGGAVALTTAALAQGTHSITALYSGDDVFAPSSMSIAQVVGDSSSSAGLQFHPLPRPVRLLDTRPGQSAFVHPGTALVPNQPLSLPGRVTIDGVTIPVDAQALVGNATVDNTAGAPAGFATLWPSGSALPLASNLNFVPGTVRPNQFTVGLGSDGTFNLLSNTGGHFIIDITGYYALPAPGGLYFHPLPQPVRLLDTRSGASAFVHPNAALTPGQTLNLPGRFTSAGVTVPPSAAALAGNATVDSSINVPPGFATLFPGGTPLPATSNLNYAAGTVAPNAFTVALGSDGSFNLFSQSGGNFVIDITGYYDSVPAGGLLLHALTQPVRELDTRPGASASVHPDAAVGAAGTLNLPGSFTFAGITVPPSATALVGNATVDNTVNAPPGFATIFPGATTLPLASNLNYSPGLVAPNAFIVGVGADGTYNLFSQSSTNYIIDISGYFAAT